MTDRSRTAEAARYEIVVEARLAARWARQLPGFEVVDRPGGTTALVGTVADQAELHGVLHRIRDLGVPLVALRRLDPLGPGDAEASA